MPLAFAHGPARSQRGDRSLTVDDPICRAHTCLVRSPTCGSPTGVPNPFRWVGAVWDSSTGLYEMGERYYDPTTARFTQEDPPGGGFRYADGAPINLVDPSGLMADPDRYNMGPEDAPPDESSASGTAYRAKAGERSVSGKRGNPFYKDVTQADCGEIPKQRIR
jgi:RHS repeat-associated protein